MPTTSTQVSDISLPDVMQALGCKTSDLKGLSAPDRDNLKRWLAEENTAIKAEAPKAA